MRKVIWWRKHDDGQQPLEETRHRCFQTDSACSPGPKHQEGRCPSISHEGESQEGNRADEMRVRNHGTTGWLLTLLYNYKCLKKLFFPPIVGVTLEMMSISLSGVKSILLNMFVIVKQEPYLRTSTHSAVSRRWEDALGLGHPDVHPAQYLMRS